MTHVNRKYHDRSGFDLWTTRGAWFWRLAGRGCGISTIGSASTENEAVDDAQAAVEELSARCPFGPSGRNSIEQPDPGLSITASETLAATPVNSRGDS